MIDFTILRNIASELAVMAVGDMLSTFDTAGNPSVIREYSTDKPPYPFITYDVRHYGSNHQRPVNSYFNDEDRLCYEFLENIDFKYCCKGDRSLEIISKLYNFLKMPSIRERVNYRMKGLSIQSLATIKPSPTVSGTQYVEEHSFIVKLNLINVVVDPFSKTIDGVEITGNVADETETFTFNIPDNS